MCHLPLQASAIAVAFLFTSLATTPALGQARTDKRPENSEARVRVIEKVQDPAADRKVREVRIETTIKDGEKNIQLWIDGTKYQPADENELQEILNKHDVGDVKVSTGTRGPGEHGIIRKRLDQADVVIDHDHPELIELNLAPTVDLEDINLEFDGLTRIAENYADMPMLDLKEIEALHGLHKLELHDAIGDVAFELQKIDGLDQVPGVSFEYIDSDQVQAHAAVPKAMLGVHLDGVSADLAQYLGLDEGRGIMVRQVVDDSPAAKAGLKAGDVILGIKVGDGPMENVGLEEFRSIIGQQKPDTKVIISLSRNGETKKVDARLAKFESAVLELSTPAEIGADQLTVRLGPGTPRGIVGRPANPPSDSPRAVIVPGAPDRQRELRFRTRPADPHFTDIAPQRQQLNRELEDMMRQFEQQMREMHELMEDLQRRQRELNERMQHTQPEA